MPPNKIKLIYQFQIHLEDIHPAVWRRIQVPEDYSFWDLHVAIQDAMGWFDYHLHSFRIRPKHKRKDVEIGIPDEEFGIEILPGWEIGIKDLFSAVGASATYEYDFGDSWIHKILLEGILLKEDYLRYPICLAGGGACPPEDCGGPQGYRELLEVIQDPSDPEHQDMIAWLKHHVKNYHPFKPDRFDPAEVQFDDPKKRFKIAFRQKA